MQNNVFNKINVSTRILILLLLSSSILIANSIYLMLFMSIFFIILFILTNKSVKSYMKLLKNIKFLLLFIFITYIIIFRNVLNGLFFTYKIILIILYVKQFTLTVNFQNLNNGINSLLKPMKLDKFSYDILIFIYFVTFYIISKEQVFTNYSGAKKEYYTFSLKYNVFPRIFLAVSKINMLESSLKLKFYKKDYENNSMLSNIVLSIFLLLFMVIVLREVIL